MCGRVLARALHTTWRDHIQARVEIALLSRLIKLPRGGLVLEIGCGYGNALKSLAAAAHAKTLIGCDINESALHRAVEWGNAPRFLLAAADAAHLPFADKSIDLIFDFGTLYHVKNQRGSLLEIERVLTSEGVLVYETRLAQA